MGAPAGNNYWQFRNKHGRDHQYTPDAFWDEAEKYFAWMANRVWVKNEAVKSGDLAGTLIKIPTSTPMSIESFCMFADISVKTFHNYEKHNDFVQVCSRIRSVVELHQFEGATVGAYNPSIIARKLGLTDKTDVTTNGESINVISLGAGTKPVE